MKSIATTRRKDLASSMYQVHAILFISCKSSTGMVKGVYNMTRNVISIQSCNEHDTITYINRVPCTHLQGLQH